MDVMRYIEDLALQSEGAFKRTGVSGIRSAGAPVSAAIDVGAVIAFDGQVSRQERMDVLDSVQLAQRAATGQYDRFTQVEAWYSKFTEVMERVGWVPLASAMVRHDQKSGELEMDAEALGILEAIATGGALTVLKQAIAALKGSANESRKITLFQRYATTDSSGNFQVGAVQKKDGSLTMTMGAIHYQARDRRVGVIFGKWGANEVQLWSSAQNMEFHTNQYAKVRELVMKKLGDATGYVADLGQLA